MDESLQRNEQYFFVSKISAANMNIYDTISPLSFSFRLDNMTHIH